MATLVAKGRIGLGYARTVELELELGLGLGPIPWACQRLGFQLESAAYS